MPEKDRHFDSSDHRSRITVPRQDDPVLVVCPECGGLGKVFPGPGEDAAIQFGCTKCGLSKRRKPQSRMFHWNDADPVDLYFGFSLWLNASCCGERLWICNRRHWDVLDSYVRAEHRERRQNDYGWRNASFVSRLPRWISSKKNRDSILKTLRVLKKKAGWED